MGDVIGNGLAAANTGAFLLCVAFLGYVLLILVPYLRHRPGPVGDPTRFRWHLIIPCLDEASVIADTVARTRRHHPEAHLWCIDDASNDATGAILRRLAAADPHVHVVARRHPHAQVGKGKALNAAWRAIDAWQPLGTDRNLVLVGVLDADGRLDPRCFEVVAGERFFGNPAVSAVQVQVRMSDVHRDEGDVLAPRRGLVARTLVRLQDLEFTTVIAAMQTLRGEIGSVGMGGNGQFTRLSVLNEIADDSGNPWHGALLEDLELGLHVMLLGHKTAYCHDTWVAQQALPGVRALVRQRSRWAQGSMQCFRYFVPVLRNPAIPTAGALEIAHFLLLPWLQLVGTVFYTLCTAVMVWYAATNAAGVAAWFGTGVAGLLPLFLLFGLGPLMVWGPVYRRRVDPSITRRKAVALGLANWPYCYLNYAAVWWAFARVVRGRSDWKKTARTASGPATSAAPPIPAVTAPAAPTPLVPALGLGPLHPAPRPTTAAAGRLRLAPRRPSTPHPLDRPPVETVTTRSTHP